MNFLLVCLSSLLLSKTVHCIFAHLFWLTAFVEYHLAESRYSNTAYCELLQYPWLIYTPHSCTELYNFNLNNILYILNILYCQSSTFCSYLCAYNDCSLKKKKKCFIYPAYYVYCNAQQNHQGKFLAFEIFVPIYLFRSPFYISW